MAEYILKDSRGKEQTFADDKIFVQGTDGELVQFTMGTGEAVLENLEVTENGTYTPGEGVDGFGSVVVDVDPTKVTILKEQTLTGFAPSSTYGGLYVKELASGTDGVVFDISIGKKYLITWDGIEYTVTAQDASSVMAGAIFMGNGSLFGLSGNNEPFVIGYSNNALLFMSLTETVESHSVGIWQKVTQEITLQDKTITENGTYSADSGYDGLGSVTVEVAGSGGGSLPAGVYWEADTVIGFPNSYYQRWFKFNGILYALTLTNSGATGSSNVNVYKWDGGSWALVTTSASLGGYYGFYNMQFVEYNGKIHFMGAETTAHYTFDGTTVTKLNDCANRVAGGVFIQNGTLKAYSMYDGVVYEWDEETDSWIAEATIGSKYAYYYFANIGDTAYAIKSKILYKYEAGVATKVSDLPISQFLNSVTLGTELYWADTSGVMCKIDVTTLEITMLGNPPVWSGGCNLVNIDDYIHIIACDNTFEINCLMHEVTE